MGRSKQPKVIPVTPTVFTSKETGRVWTQIASRLWVCGPLGLKGSYEEAKAKEPNFFPDKELN